MKRDALKLLPLLLLYVVVIATFSSESMVGDEGGYAGMAERMVHRSAEPGSAHLWWGPGYPMVLVPFVLLRTPWLVPTLLNALFLFGAVCYFHRTLRLYLSSRQATVIAYILGLYPPFLREAHQLLTESLVFFLVCGLMFHFVRASRAMAGSRRHILLAALYAAYLALTKVIFGYVLMAALPLAGILVLLRMKNVLLRRWFLLSLASFALCLPYLAYTHAVSGRWLYWGSAGGLSLYWMSSSQPGELGSWFSPQDLQQKPELAGHREFFDRIAPLSRPEWDRALQRQALDNIARHPQGYLRNWAANVGRLLFSYPFSHGRQSLRTYFYMLPNMFLVVLLALGACPAVLRWRRIPPEIRALLVLSGLWFGATSLVSAYDRQFRPLVPILLLWIGYLYLRILNISLREEAAADGR